MINVVTQEYDNLTTIFEDGDDTLRTTPGDHDTPNTRKRKTLTFLEVTQKPLVAI